jgi:hypothetical protein
MKKYLMTGLAAIAICAAFTSCSKNDELYNPEQITKNEAAQIQENYNQAFIATFGQPAANHDWGFGASAKTRVANTNSNEWFKPIDQQGYGLQKPDDLFPEEIEYVMNYFSSVKQGHGETLDLKNYFVQQVAYGNKDNQGVRRSASGQVFETIRDGQAVYRTENYEVQSKEHMDWIAANLKADVQSESDCDHVNNFNTASGSLMYMQNSETQYGFAFKDSWGTVDNLVSTNYYMVHLIADYKGKHIDGWYVGFDYQTSKEEMGANNDPNMVKSSVRLAPDGIYNDRVVKIVPAGEIEKEWDIRIIAEDLNATAQDTPAPEDGFDESDWDFNDVVFDVKFTSQTTANVKIVGAGGVLPLYVDGHEAHEALGQSGPDSKGYYRIQNSGNATPFEVTGINRDNNGKDIVITVVRISSTGDPIISELTAPNGKPAAKIGVDPKFKPCAEREDIRERYPMFMNWVQTNFSGAWYDID